MCVAAVRGSSRSFFSECWDALEDVSEWLGFEKISDYNAASDEQGPFVLLRIPESERNRLAKKFAAKEKTP